MDTYAAYSIDNCERMSSSSGGIFSLIAKEIFSKNGAVYGVAMTSDCKSAEFIRAVNEDDLRKLQTSKYMQAHVGDAFKNVKKDLDEGLYVLFTGTSCQVNGLIGFLSANDKDYNRYSNLYCIDVICHGVPSPGLWRKYVNYLEEKNHAKVIDINFRYKCEEIPSPVLNQLDEYNKEYIVPKNKDPYMYMFLSDYCLRPACHECKSKANKLSDITLGDFWGVENISPKMSDGKGTSLIIVRTEKGNILIEKIKNKIKIMPVSYEDAISYNPAEFRSAKRPIERDYFFKDMNALTFGELSSKYAADINMTLKKKIKYQIKRNLVRAGIIEPHKDMVFYGLRFILNFKPDKRNYK